MKKDKQRFKTVDHFMANDKMYVSYGYLASLHKSSTYTISKQLSAVNEKFSLDALRLGNSTYFNAIEANMVVSSFQNNFDTIVKSVVDTLNVKQLSSTLQEIAEKHQD